MNTIETLHVVGSVGWIPCCTKQRLVVTGYSPCVNSRSSLLLERSRNCYVVGRHCEGTIFGNNNCQIKLFRTYLNSIQLEAFSRLGHNGYLVAFSSLINVSINQTVLDTFSNIYIVESFRICCCYISTVTTFCLWPCSNLVQVGVGIQINNIRSVPECARISTVLSGSWIEAIQTNHRSSIRNLCHVIALVIGSNKVVPFIDRRIFT